MLEEFLDFNSNLLSKGEDGPKLQNEEEDDPNPLTLRQ